MHKETLLSERSKILEVDLEEEVEDAEDGQVEAIRVDAEGDLVVEDTNEVVDEIDLVDLVAMRDLHLKVALQQVEDTLVTQLHERADTKEEDREVTNEVDDQEVATREEDAEGERLRLHLQEDMQVVARAQVAQLVETLACLEGRKEEFKKIP